MLFLVIAEARDSIVGDLVPMLRADVGKAVKRIGESGKLQTGGVCAGRRKLFFLLEMESAAEILELLGGELIDNANVSVDPVLSFEELGKFFAKHPA